MLDFHFVTVLNIKYRVSCILIISTTKIWILKKAVQPLSPQPVSHSFILIVKIKLTRVVYTVVNNIVNLNLNSIYNILNAITTKYRFLAYKKNNFGN